MTKTAIAIAATLLMSTATNAMADSGKRHPVSARAKATSVRVDQNSNMSMMPGTNNLMMNVMDRASSPFACGG